MRKKQVFALFICNLVPWTIGNGLVPLLPIYAIQLGANPTTSGNYMAFSYLAISLGAISAGWVSDRFHKRKIPIIIASLVCIPTAWLMGRAGNVWNLSILTAVLWFWGGLGLALIGVLTGLTAGKNERGKIFGILSLTSGLGAFIGGLSSGLIVDHWGYQTLFTVVSIFLLTWPFAGLFLTEKKTEAVEVQTGEVKKEPALGKNFLLVFCASLVASIAGFVILFGRSLLMEGMGFSASQVSLTGAVSGLVAMPLPLLLGWLSDRKERKVFLYAGYVVGIASLVLIAVSTSLWHFSVALALQAIFVGVNATLGNALVTDLLPPESLGRGLALFGATAWIGGVLGFAGAGFALQNVGVLSTFIISMGLPLIGIGLLIPVRIRQKA